MEKITIWGVPYDVVIEHNIALIHAPYYAEQLKVTHRFVEQHRGVPLGEKFLLVDSDGINIEFRFLDNTPVTLADVEQFFIEHLQGIQDIGYEVLVRE